MDEIEIGHKCGKFEINCSYMEKIFYDLFHPQKPLILPRDRGWHPFTNVYELSSEIVIEVELAGISHKEVQISFQDKYLVVRGHRKERIKGTSVLYHQLEVEYGAFERIIYVPFDIDEKRIQGYYEDGFLTIRLPKVCSKNFPGSTTTIGGQE
ncbi:MAG: Hsp20/alpha crystallin family protein [bacterium]